MSLGTIFKDISNAEHTAAAWLEKELTVLYGKAPELVKVADAVLKYAGPALQIIVTMEAGSAAGDEVANVVSQAQSDLAVASALIYDFGPTPQAATLISGVSDNLTGLLAAGHVKNATNVASVTKVVKSISALSTALSKPATA